MSIDSSLGDRSAIDRRCRGPKGEVVGVVAVANFLYVLLACRTLGVSGEREQSIVAAICKGFYCTKTDESTRSTFIVV